MPVKHNTTLLRHSCYLGLDRPARQRFRELALEISDWQALIEEAESHALSNLLYTHLLSCDITVPDQHRIMFKAVTARHQRANRERSNALNEILDKFSEHNIKVLLLKGMALINCLYPNPYQRPMGDIDILVSAQQALLAQQSLREIGYSAQDRKQGYLYDHHHLPVAVRNRNGQIIQVEIHHTALSGDAMGSMAFDDVFASANPMTVNSRDCFTLGHNDMLKHLCHHTFEPCDRIKLGAVADIYGYATKYFENIDWSYLQKKQPYVPNTLRCLHFLSPLPAVLAEKLSTPATPPPAGVGKGFPPLSDTQNDKGPLPDKLGGLLKCSDWWRHIYYTIPPEHSLIMVKIFRHPVRVAYWLFRRFRAGLRSRRAQ